MNKAKCLTCEGRQYSRGLCKTCFIQARKLIATGETTDVALVANGLMKPSKGRGRGTGSFMKAFKAACEAKS